MTGKTMLPPHPCARCKRTMHSAAELTEETYTQICDACALKPAYREVLQALDGAIIWSCPPPDPATSRFRIIKIAYVGCGNCDGKGCDICLATYNNHPVRLWIKEREDRIQRATQTLYTEALKKEGILELAKKNCAPPGRLQRALGPLMIRHERIVSMWKALVVTRLKPLNPSRM